MYAVGDTGFRDYLARAFRGNLSLWPTDLALYLHLQRLPEVVRRRLQRRFQPHSFVVNLGNNPSQAAAEHATAGQASAEEAEQAATSSLRQLRNRWPHAYLLHSARLTRALVDGEGGGGLGVEAPWLDQAVHAASFAAGLTLGGGSAETKEAGTHARGAVMDAKPEASGQLNALLRLADRRSDPQRRLVVSFVSSAYHELCDHWLHHVHRHGLRHYLLVAFDAAQAAQLEAQGEEPHFEPMAGLSAAGGSDVFASRDFFTLNAARYRVLVSLLRGGIDVFAVDLDVVLLRDPLPLVGSMPFELLLQSDARNFSSMIESSPYLLRDRLGLAQNTDSEGTPGITYVNGGVFFARGTAAIARLFEDAWALASLDLGKRNEQDCLNLLLHRSAIRWSPLPPALFPNGFVYFRRPPPPHLEAREGPVLVHCNWISGLAAKRYLLTEAGLWGIPAAPASGRYLTYDVGERGDALSLGGQLRALLAAMEFARHTNRTLVLPRFFIRSGPEGGPARGSERSFAYLFDYAVFAARYPRHREHVVLKQLRPLRDGNGTARAPPLATSSLLAWLTTSTSQAEPVLHLGTSSGPWARGASGSVIAGGAISAFPSDTESAAALQPAPELRSIALHVVHSLRAYASRDAGFAVSTSIRAPRSLLAGRGKARRRNRAQGGMGGMGEFDCLYVRREALFNTTLLRLAAAKLPRQEGPTLLVGEGGFDDDWPVDVPAATAATGFTAFRGTTKAVISVLPQALSVTEFFPYWDLVEVSDATGARTLSFDAVQQLACAQARHIEGEAGSSFVRAVCHWRAVGALSDKAAESTSDAASDVCRRLHQGRREGGRD